MSGMENAVRATQETYSLPEPLADARIDELPAGSNLLVAGPTRTQKHALALDLLAHGERKHQPAIIVSPNVPANRLLQQFEAALASEMPPTYIVDCTGSEPPADLPGLAHVECVSSPDDLTGIGVGIAKSMRAAGEEAADGLRLANMSLSTLLQYTTEDRVFNFAHVVSGRITAADYLGVWTLDTDSHEQTTVNTLCGRFEYAAELRETGEGAREMRVLGGPDEWRSWVTL